MNRRINPWVTVLTAALTFGSLMAFVGPRSFHHYRGHWSHEQGYYNEYGHDRGGTCHDGGHHSRNLIPKSDSLGDR